MSSQSEINDSFDGETGKIIRLIARKDSAIAGLLNELSSAQQRIQTLEAQIAAKNQPSDIPS
jgi:hypothetical protein